jgi:YVTN family beta-propeller protein
MREAGMRGTRRFVRSILAGTLGLGGLVAIASVVFDVGSASADTGFVTFNCSFGGAVSIDVTGTVPATVTAGTRFSISGYQVDVQLTQSQVAGIESFYGATTLSGDVEATVTDVGATPSSLTQDLGTFSVPLPNPPTPVSYSVPTTPTTFGPFTATSSHVVFSSGHLDLTYSNLNMSSDCTPPTPTTVVTSTQDTGPFTLVGNGGDGTVSVLNTSDGSVVGSPIPVGGTPDYIALAPNGSKALVSTWPGGNSLVPVNTATLTAGSPIAIQAPRGIAITPDGQTAWVTGGSSDDTLYPVSMATNKIGVPVVVDPSGSAASVAISPDGKTAYVVSQFTGLIPVDLTTETVASPVALPGFPAEVNITPDGTTAYVSAGDELVPVDLTVSPPVAGTPIVPCGSGNSPDRFAITPDGSTAYVGCFNSGDVVPVGLSTATVGTPIAIGSPSDVTIGVAVSPDGSTVYAADSTTNTVVPIDTATNTAGTPISVGSSPQGIGIMPDVGPQASLSVAQDQSDPSGLTEDFDAGASVSNTSRIASYAWDFGDGGTDVTTEATDSHVYASGGSYTATVTETDAAGTSTTEVTTGQQTLRDGSAGASASAQFTLSTCSSGCTPTVTSPDNNATVVVTQAASTEGTLTLSVAPSILACGKRYHEPAEVSTLTESSAFSSNLPILVQDTTTGLATTKGVRVCYQPGGNAPPAPAFLKKCSPHVPAPCYESLTQAGTNAVTAGLDVPPGDPRFWIGYGTLTLTKIAPSSGAIGQSVSVKGKNLSQTTGLLFSGRIPGTFVAATNFTIKSSTVITATVPPGAVTGPVKATTQLGSATSTKAFKVQSQ